MKLKEYIEKYKDEIYSIECFVNTKDIMSLNDENTREFLFAKDGTTSSTLENLTLSPTLMENTPMKCYLLTKSEYELFFYNSHWEKNISENKKILIPIYPNIISRKSGQKIQKIANLQYYKSKANYGTKKKGISR